MKKAKATKRVLSYPYVLFMLIFIITPLCLILVSAFLDENNKLTLENFKLFFTSSSSFIILGNSLLVGLITSIICLVIGYPVAYILSKLKSGKILVIFFIMPMWVNFLIRTLATKTIFMMMGVKLGIGTVLFGMVYNFLPFFILPLHTSLSSIDKSYIEAAKDLGANNLNVFLKTILPLSLDGIFTGLTMVFIPTISSFAISQILSNGKIFLFGDSIQTSFDQGLYGVGSIMSILMLIFVIVSNVIIKAVRNKGAGPEVKKAIW